MKYLIALSIIAALFYQAAQAALPESPVFSWVNPTQNTDGSQLTDLAETRIDCTGLAPISVPAPATSYTPATGDFVDGTYNCTAESVNSGGVASASVTFLQFTVQQVPISTTPMPVTGQSVD